MANYREPVTHKPLTEAVAEYVATKQHEHEQDFLSEPHLTSMKRDLKRLEKALSRRDGRGADWGRGS